MIAFVCCEKITGNNAKQESARASYREAINRAMLANAIMNPPSYRADNSWMLARISG
jgi:hypothetical protein